MFDGTGAQGGADGRHLTGLSEVRFGGNPAGGVIVAPSVAQVSSQHPFDLDRLGRHTVDGSGMSGIGEAGDTHSNASEGVVWTTMGNLSPGPSDLDPFIIYDLGGVVDVTGQQGGPDGRFLTGLSEVRFVVESPDDIPEPVTVVLLGMGIAGLGGYLRRRRRRA